MSSSGVSVGELLEHALAERLQAQPPVAVHRARLRRAEQLDLQAVQRDRDLALAGDLLEQPVGQLLGPRGGVEVGAAEAIGDRADPADLAARGPAQRGLRMSALATKCQVVEESDTPASAATRRCVTAATPSRATIRTVAATIASRTRSEASAREPVAVDTGAS